MKADEKHDSSLAAAADRIVRDSLCVRAGERLLLLMDEPHADLARAVNESARSVRAACTTLFLEDCARQPFTTMPPPVLEAMDQCDVCLWASAIRPGEGASRRAFWTLFLREKRVRCGYILASPRGALLAGTSIDPRRMQDRARAIRARLTGRSIARITSAAGTNLLVSFSDRYHWAEDSGHPIPGNPTQLPAGELSTHPESVDGVYVVDGSVASSTEGHIAGAGAVGAVRLELKAGRVTKVHSPLFGAKIQLEFRRYADLDRVGIVCFGTNTGLISSHDSFAVDHKMPGLHVVLGHTFREVTGAGFTSFALLGTTCLNADVDLDSVPLIRRGRYLI